MKNRFSGAINTFLPSIERFFESINTFSAVRKLIYGIAAYADSEENGTATIVASVHDVTADKQALAELASLCNRLELSTIHLLDVVEDFLAS